MKHASERALDELDDLLVELRGLPGLVERKRGVFYGKSRAVLHFHEDPAGLFADLRPGAGWLRLPVNTPEEREELLMRLRAGES